MRVARLAWLAAALALLVIAPPSRATEQDVQRQPDGCGEIHSALQRLAQAERAQAFALQLFVRGQESSGRRPDSEAALGVEKALQQLLDGSSALRSILKRISRGPAAREAAVAGCLKLGYRSLFEAERLISDVERVLFEIRGLATRSRARRNLSWQGVEKGLITAVQAHPVSTPR